MSDKENLRAMLDNLINGKPEQAQTVFHTYLKGKFQDAFDIKHDETVQLPDRNEE